MQKQNNISSLWALQLLRFWLFDCFEHSIAVPELPKDATSQFHLINFQLLNLQHIWPINYYKGLVAESSLQFIEFKLLIFACFILFVRLPRLEFNLVVSKVSYP